MSSIENSHLVIDITEEGDGDTPIENDLEVVEVKVNRVFRCTFCLQFFSGHIEFKRHFMQKHWNDAIRSRKLLSMPNHPMHFRKRPLEQQGSRDDIGTSSSRFTKAKVLMATITKTESTGELELNEEERKEESLGLLPSPNRQTESGSEEISCPVPEVVQQPRSQQVVKVGHPSPKENEQDLRKRSTIRPKISLLGNKKAINSIEPSSDSNSSDECDEQENNDSESLPNPPKQYTGSETGTGTSGMSIASGPEQTQKSSSGVKISLFGILPSTSSSSPKETEKSGNLLPNPNDQPNIIDSADLFPVPSTSRAHVPIPGKSPNTYEPDSTTTTFDKPEQIYEFTNSEPEPIATQNWKCRRCPFEFPTEESLTSHMLLEHHRSSAEGKNYQDTAVQEAPINQRRRRMRGGGKKSKKIYCICQRTSYGDMIGCDNKLCKIQWFHYPCVGVISPPIGKWYCPPCMEL